MSENKPIGILSMQRVVNFGSVLQAYSLRQMIREVTGRNVVFVDIDTTRACASMKTISENVDYEQPAAYPPGLIQRGKRWAITRLSAYNKRLIRDFMARELSLDNQESVAQYAHVVIGSDEVFNHRNESVCLQLHGAVENADHVITYAASCGNAMAGDILEADKQKVKDAMERIGSVSVRDNVTATYVKEICGRDTVHHLDPVLVGDLRDRKIRPVGLKNYMIVYAYGQRIRTHSEIEAIRQFAQKHKLKTVALGGSQFWCDLYIPLSPFRMLDYFAHADYVVTDTFHGAIFSVINGKQFAVIPRKTNNGKLSGLLADLNLSDRTVEQMEDLEAVLTKTIPYGEIDQILSRERERTREYLKEQLGV